MSAQARTQIDLLNQQLSALRQQIAALENSVRVTTEQVAQLQQEKDRWADPAYIASQARARLYYFQPGEVVYLIDDDLPDTAIPLASLICRGIVERIGEADVVTIGDLDQLPRAVRKVLS